ncbi:MAG: hypothetical protein PHF86_13000 [Candidatus Nanoarchaeia archaeon]|nr:hypothetical protein [Candidatus Nanoarchaeia archaeon]
MVEIKFSRLKKDFPKSAKELVTDQELVLTFLNSPIRDKVMKFSKLNRDEIKSINEIVNYYSKLKIEVEKKSKPKLTGDLTKLEVEILKNIFSAEMLTFKNLKMEEAFEIAKKIIKVEYPNSVILNMLETDKIATLLGLETEKEFPSELLVFDTLNNKIVGVEILLK